MTLNRSSSYIVAAVLGLFGAAGRADVASGNLSVCGSTIQVNFGGGDMDLSRADLLRWVRVSAESVAAYYGRFPVKHETVLITIAPGQEGVLSGRTWGSPSVRARIAVGERSTLADLSDDWVMTHEFVHTAFPDQKEEHHWMEEGLATYIEPIARVQHGVLKQDQVWSDMIRDMPQGEPRIDDHGLDRTHTHGRTYWGGAMFFLLADVTIRDRTANKMGLQDALRAIMRAGNIQVDSTPQTTLMTGDKATGVTVLMELYNQMRDEPVAVDLDALWKRLGVRKLASGVIAYDNHAPSAGARESIFRQRLDNDCTVYQSK